MCMCVFILIIMSIVIVGTKTFLRIDNEYHNLDFVHSVVFAEDSGGRGHPGYEIARLLDKDYNPICETTNSDTVNELKKIFEN